MKGLTKGEQASTTNPVLQLLVRVGGFLTDIYSGTFRIDDVVAPAGTVVARVASTPINTTTHRIGLGRYAVPSGATSSWVLGTHRVVYTYVLVAGGPTYTQVQEFELLSSSDWPVGYGFLTYLSTRKAWQDGVAAETVGAAELHRQLRTKSVFVDQATGRFFEPRYLSARIRGSGTPMLLLDQPIIALEGVSYAFGDDATEYPTESYRVYNRHLSGNFISGDDRTSPKIAMLSGEYMLDSGSIAVATWPSIVGEQNVLIKGVFGYTDPDPDPNGADIGLGHTPDDIAQVVGALVARMRLDPTLSSPTVSSPGSIRMMKTRDQSVMFGVGVGDTSPSSSTGDPVLDRILMRYTRPASLSYPDDERYWSPYWPNS